MECIDLKGTITVREVVGPAGNPWFRIIKLGARFVLIIVKVALVISEVDPLHALRRLNISITWIQDGLRRGAASPYHRVATGYPSYPEPEQVVVAVFEILGIMHSISVGAIAPGGVENGLIREKSVIEMSGPGTDGVETGMVVPGTHDVVEAAGCRQKGGVDSEVYRRRDHGSLEQAKASMRYSYSSLPLDIDGYLWLLVSLKANVATH